MEHFEATISFEILSDGECNAVAFWFDLQLDEQSILSGDPKQSTVRPANQYIVSEMSTPLNLYWSFSKHRKFS